MSVPPFQYFIQHCFIFRPSDSTVSEDAGIEPRIISILALAARRSIERDVKFFVKVCTVFFIEVYKNIDWFWFILWKRLLRLELSV